MIEQLISMKEQLTELASVLNAFKSEAVQLRLLEFILRGAATGGQVPEKEDEIQRKPARHRKSGAEEKGGTAPAGRKGSRSSTGPKLTLDELIALNFFAKPRTINDIIVHCKHTLARGFKATDLSGSLTRMVRKGQLKRKKNADHQYEYEKP